MLITVPPPVAEIERAHQRASDAIMRMSPSRSYGAQAELSVWRKWVQTLDLSKDNGYAFDGPLLRAGEQADVPPGAVLVALDRSFAKANWYSHDHHGTVLHAALFRVEPNGGLTTLITSDRPRGWVRDLLGFIQAHPEIPLQPRSPSSVTPRPRYGSRSLS